MVETVENLHCAHDNEDLNSEKKYDQEKIDDVIDIATTT